jgi:hypothetical protein
MNFIRLKDYINSNCFGLILALFSGFILVMFLYRKLKGLKGTWSTSYFIPGRDTNTISNYENQRTPPTDSKGELECRRVLQYIFKVPFDKARPDFLRNPVTGGRYNLELDCFDASLRLAVEYNGQQHYKYLPFFHRTKDAFYNQGYRDEIKRRMCKDNGVNLIEVPYTVKLPDIKWYIENELRKLGYKVK